MADDAGDVPPAAPPQEPAEVTEVPPSEEEPGSAPADSEGAPAEESDEAAGGEAPVESDAPATTEDDSLAVGETSADGEPSAAIADDTAATGDETAATADDTAATDGDGTAIEREDAAPAEVGEGGDGTGEAQVGEGGVLDESMQSRDVLDDTMQSGDVSFSNEVEDAATKIQSLARAKSSRDRVQRIKMGIEDPFAEGGEKVRRERKTADGAEEDIGEGDESLEQSMEGEAGQGESGKLDDSDMDDAELKAAAELKAREEKLRLEGEARQARIDQRLEIGKKYAAAVAQRDELVASNTELQRKLAANLAAKRSEEQAAAALSSTPEESAEVSQGDMQTRYFQALRQVADNRAELDKVQLSYDHMVLDMKTRLEQKQEKVRELKATYTEIKTAVAMGTSGGSTGRIIPVKLLKQLEDQAGEKEADLEKVRLKNIHLRNQLRKLESNLRRKEELSNELHLIDFEQLKIENQTLNEKIEERNEELLKLRKKTTTTVQVLTHLKEKLQFVQAENQLLKVELAELEAELANHRDSLTRAKHERDGLRSENLSLRGQAGLIGNNDLLRDFDRRKKDIASMQVTLDALKNRHRTLRRQVVDISAKAVTGSY